MISKILFEEKYDSFKSSDNKNRVINLARVNIFIGENNSGKSRFLRNLFADNKISFIPTNFKWDEILDVLKNYQEKFKLAFNEKGYDQVGDVMAGFRKLFEVKTFNSQSLNSLYSDLNGFVSSLVDIRTIGGASHLVGSSASVGMDYFVPVIKSIGVEMKEVLKDLIPGDFNLIFSNYYIPVLRGIKGVQTNNSSKDGFTHDDNYKHRTNKDYFSKNGIAKGSEIFTGLNIFEDVRKMTGGLRSEKLKLKNFELFLSETFFKGQQIDLTSNVEFDELYIGIGSDERPIYEYGDGIQSIILLLFPLFLNQGKNILFFIEEPELALHPGMQRIFMETIMRKEFSTFQYFISTHSNHFLDLTLDLKDISVYTFNKKEVPPEQPSFIIENVSNSDTRTLDLIGVRGSSLFLSNCTIWVEGISDRLYIKKYLDIYQEHLIKQKKIKTKFFEDIHYSFLEYQGSNVVHWSFINDNAWDKINALGISKKIYLIADTDDSKVNPDGAKSVRYQKLQEHLKDNFRLVQGREIENTLKREIIIEVILELEKENADNVTIKEFEFNDYNEKELGDFINSNFQSLRRSYAQDSGTIKDKLGFCNIAIEKIESFDDLSTEGVKLADDIFNFILKSNS